MLVRVLEMEESLAKMGEWLLCHSFQKMRALVLSFVADVVFVLFLLFR